MAKGSWPAQFNVDKLTVFEVIVKDANITDLEQACTELRKNLEQLGEKKDCLFKTLIFSINGDYYSAREIQLRTNSARTPHELRTGFYEAFSKTRYSYEFGGAYLPR